MTTTNNTTNNFLFSVILLASIKEMLTKVLTVLIDEGGRFQFAFITAITGVEQRKGDGNPFFKSEVRRRAIFPLMLNGNYSRMVNARRKKEAEAKGENYDTFTAKSAWFVKVFDSDNGSIVCHKKDAILDENGYFVDYAVPNPRLYLFGVLNPNAKVETLDYFINGKVANEDEKAVIKHYTPEPTENKSQELDEPILPLTITLSDFINHKGIEQVKAGGYVVTFPQVI